MDQIENFGILDEIQSIVSDKLQVVSYKWLSRNFLVSSNVAKRLLEEFVEKYGSGLEVVYSLSGWLKNDPSTYHIRIVSKQKLSDAKQDFVANCSIQIYSVQGCLPKDPATLWNHEFVQTECLFKQPLAVDNCLWDNRFCGVSNSCVQRTGEAPLGSGILQVKTTELPKSLSSNQPTTGSHPLTKKVLQTNSNTVLRFPDHVKTMKHENSVKQDQEQLTAHKGKAPLPTKEDNCQSHKTSSGTGSALASMWDRASAKSKPDVSLRQASNSRKNSTASAEAPISAHESVSSDEDPLDLNVKRSLNGEGSRKRRVRFNYSDEEDDYKDAVPLASPNPKNYSLDPNQNSNASSRECNLNFQDNENKQVVKKVRETGGTSSQPSSENISTMVKETSMETLSCLPEVDASVEDKVPNTGSKRSKVLKTKIDERGREITEVVREVS